MNKLFQAMVCALVCTLSVTAALRYTADSNVDDITFVNTVGTTFFNQASQEFLIGSSSVVGGNEYSLAFTSRFYSKFTKMAPEKVELDGTSGAANPFYGAKIHLISSVRGSNPVVVGDTAKNVAYVFKSHTDPDNIKIVASPAIKDHAGTAADEIDALYPGPSTTKSLFFASMRDAATTAIPSVGVGVFNVAPQEGELAIAWADTTTKDDFTGNNATQIKSALDGSAQAVSGAVALHWDAGMSRLFVGLDISNTVSGGALSVMVGRFEGGILTFEQFAPATAFGSATTGDKVVGIYGSGQKVAALQLRTMYTSSQLRYLVVLGGAGNTDSASKKSIYALPLVSSGDADKLGTLAKAGVDPTDAFYPDTPFAFKSRHFETAAGADEAPDKTDAAVQVGGGDLPGTVSRIDVVTDAVYAFVDADGISELGGVFHSQAILNANGSIVSWTNWQRVQGRAKAIFTGNIDAATGDFWTVDSSKTSVFSTRWGISGQNGLLGGTSSSSKVGLVQLMSDTFPVKNAGVQGFFDLPKSNAGFSQTVGERISMFVATGYKKVMLVESGRDVAGVFTPRTGDFSTGELTSTDGSLGGFDDVATRPALIISGGDLDTVQAINSVTIVDDGNYGWLCVGGYAGIAVLQGSAGVGWATAGLKSGLVGLSDSMSFKLLGDLGKVRKLVGQGDKLYVLTNKNLYRITLSAAQVAAGASATVVTLATADDDQRFSDILITDKLALLATSDGMLRSGDGVDVATATSATIDFTDVTMNESTGSVIRFHAVTDSGLETDLYKGGDLYVTNASVPGRSSRCYRFYVKIVSSAVSSTTVAPIKDYYVQNGTKTNYFLSFKDYRNFVVTDGGFLINTRSGYNGTAAVVSVLPLIKLSNRRFSATTYGITVTMPSNSFYGQHVWRPVRSSASGAWIVPGSFGIELNE